MKNILHSTWHKNGGAPEIYYYYLPLFTINIKQMYTMGPTGNGIIISTGNRQISEASKCVSNFYCWSLILSKFIDFPHFPSARTNDRFFSGLKGLKAEIQG